MGEAPFAAVLGVHAVTLCVLGAATLWTRRSLLVLALAALLVNAVPVSRLLGMAAPIYLQDLALPLAVALALWHAPPRDEALLPLVALAAFLWPALGTMVGLGENIRPGMGENGQFLFRRFAFVAYFAAGLSGALRRGQLMQFLDAALALWVGMAVAGALQYAGLLENDLWSATDPERSGQDPAESAPGGRGFMGLNRGAVGVWGSAAASYALAMLATLPRRPVLRLVAYGVAAVVSTAGILISGSRTGLLAVIAAAVYTAVRATGPRGRVLRVLAPAAVVAVAVSIAAADAEFQSLWARFSPTESSYDTGQQRADVQQATTSFVLNEPRALTIGMGHSTAEFRRRVGDRFDLAHSHSEYVEVLWEAGAVGLALYGAFLLALYRRLRAPPGAAQVLAAARPMLVAGLVAGIAIGNMFITSARLAPFSLLMAFVYGAFVHEAGERRREGLSEGPSGVPRPRPTSRSSSCRPETDCRW